MILLKSSNVFIKCFSVYYEDSGPYGILERVDSPYMTSQKGAAYFEDCTILNGFLYLQNDVGLSHKTGFSGSLLVMGGTGAGKTR